MIKSVLAFALMIMPSQAPITPNGALVLEINQKNITLNFCTININKIEEVTDCVYLAWRTGRISHRAAIQALARLACVDDARVKGRPLSFHGDSWVSTGHWSKVIKDVDYIYYKRTMDRSYPGVIMPIFVENGLAHWVSDKFGERIEFEKKRLSAKQKTQLIQCVQKLEDLIAYDVRFDEKEPLEKSGLSGGCEDSVVIKTPQ